VYNSKLIYMKYRVLLRLERSTYQLNHTFHNFQRQHTCFTGLVNLGLIGGKILELGGDGGGFWGGPVGHILEGGAADTFVTGEVRWSSSIQDTLALSSLHEYCSVRRSGSALVLDCLFFGRVASRLRSSLVD